MRRGSRLPLEELAPYLLEDTDLPGPFNWSRIFGNDQPVEVEVGFGKGLFLLTASEAKPQTNFLGIEIERKYQLFTANRLAKRNRTNVRLVKGDARFLIRDRILPDSVHAIHAYFPDPWWKKRHHKRRLFNADFVASCARVLIPGGRLHIATDVPDYFAIILQLLNAEPLLKGSPSPEPCLISPDLGFQTNFERKSALEGRAAHRATFEKINA